MTWLIIAAFAGVFVAVRIARARARLRAIEHEAGMSLRSVGGTP